MRASTTVNSLGTTRVQSVTLDGTPDRRHRFQSTGSRFPRMVEHANVIALSVTAEDCTPEDGYTITVTRAGPPSTDLTLSALTVNDGAMRPNAQAELRDGHVDLCDGRRQRDRRGDADRVREPLGRVGQLSALHHMGTTSSTPIFSDGITVPPGRGRERDLGDRDGGGLSAHEASHTL